MGSVATIRWIVQNIEKNAKRKMALALEGVEGLPGLEFSVCTYRWNKNPLGGLNTQTLDADNI